MTKMELAFDFAGCPRAWQNFILWLQKERDDFYRDISMNRIQQELKKFNAEYHYAYHTGSLKTPDYVSFDDEKDYIWFTLKWS